MKKRTELMPIMLAVCLLSVSAFAQNTLPPVHQLPPKGTVMELAASSPKVHLVYLVPTDKAVSQSYVTAMNAAVFSLAAWYGGQTLNHKTFQPATPAVTVIPLPHTASFYANNQRPAIYTQFWDNVLNDALPLTGGSFNDPQNVWAYYIDADPICGECGGCGTSGILVVSANDLRGLAGEGDKLFDACNPTVKQGVPPVTRWIGGLGHELGHAFGLPHPPGCDDGDKTKVCDSNALMWQGYAAYPNTYLTDAEKTSLLTSPFFFVTPEGRIRAVKH